MSTRVDAFWRCETANFVHSLNKEQLEKLHLILKSYGLINTSRAIEEDVDEILSEASQEFLARGI
ncbi:hypothetical protein [Sigmofec virus UA08Rod_7256]|uniref:Uncharacterized protein n=1 Tax=Sigmofec virus UA08Rod_7256 TaxID=2929244 RepID=A0A976N0F6_9VIRU|nr:hypothetical protein [Sigmofec virus UA08Rod_7256]